MAARKQQIQGIVVVDDLQRHFGLLRGHQLALLSGTVAPPRVDVFPKCGLGQPSTWIGRYAVARPVQRGREQRFLDSVLRSVEISTRSNKRAENLRRKLAQQ